LSRRKEWGGYDTSEGLPNDTIQSIKVGSAVRLKLFANWFWTHDEGATFNVAANNWYSSLGSWNRNASAARLEMNSQDPYCGSLPPGSLNLYDGYNYQGDCTVLSIASSGYDGAVHMAYRNDNASSFWTNQGLWFYDNAGYSSLLFSTPAGGGYCGNMSNLCGNCGYCIANSNNSDNKLSSVSH